MHLTVHPPPKTDGGHTASDSHVRMKIVRMKITLSRFTVRFLAVLRGRLPCKRSLVGGVLVAAVVMPVLSCKPKAEARINPIRCKSNLKAIGQAIALYTDCGTKNVQYLEDDLFGTLIEEDLLVPETCRCPNPLHQKKKWWPSVDFGEYEVAPDFAVSIKNSSWLVRDRWAKDSTDPSGNNNKHGKGKFNFLHSDMNLVGNENDYFQLYEK